MIGYTEVIQTMAAMIIFSMILMNANHLIHRNTVMQVSSELEREVISLGQEIIEEARTKSFDEVTHNATAPPSDIPGGFTPANQLGPESGETHRRHFNDFDDYNGWSQTVTTEHGDFQISAEVFYVDEDTFEKINTPSTFKKIEVTVTSKFLRTSDGLEREYRLEFVRNYYAD